MGKERGWFSFIVISIIVVLVATIISVDSRILLGLLLNQVAFLYNHLYSPPFEGEVFLNRSMTYPGQTYHLIDSVKMIRDNDGTFHIYAGHKRDAFFAQGYISAQERIFDVEILRRLADGRLSELKSTSLIVDRLSRTLGFRRIAEKDLQKIDEEDRKNFESYTSGLNLYLETMYDKHVPLEFFLGRIPKPEHFTVLDSLAMLRVMAWSFSRGWIGKVVKVAIRQWTSEEFEKSLDYANLRWESLEHLLEKIPISAQFEGSNSVAISSGLSLTGHPMLEADPHLAVKTPSLWIPVHLIISDEDDGVDSFGYQISCSPGIALGFNRNISYGITLSYGDASEVYLEKISDDGKSALFMDEMEEMEVFEERIKVAGMEEEFVETVRITRNGPIISGILDFQEKVDYNLMKTLGDGEDEDEDEDEDGDEFFLPRNEYSLKLVALMDFGDEKLTHTRFATDMFSSRNWDEFLKLCHDAKIVHLNLVYADSQDNIGICIAGAYPIRSERYEEDIAGGLCQGWDRACDWQGFHPSQPVVKNPEEGFIVSANHDYLGEKRPYYMGIYRSSWRADRMSRLIVKQTAKETGGGRISLQQLQEITMDTGIDGISLDLITSFARMYLENTLQKQQSSILSTKSTPKPKSFSQQSSSIHNHGMVKEKRKLHRLLKKDALKFVAERIVEFDGQFVPESCGATLYTIFFNEIQHALLERKGGLLSSMERGSEKRREKIVMKGMGKKFMPLHSFVGMRRSMVFKLWDELLEVYINKKMMSSLNNNNNNKNYKREEEKDDEEEKKRKMNRLRTQLGAKIAELALNGTISKLNRILMISETTFLSKFANDKNSTWWMNKIRYGQIHKVRFSHLLGDSIPAYRRDVDGYGGFITPLMGGYYDDEEGYDVAFYPTCRIVVDMGSSENEDEKVSGRTMVYPGSSNYLNNPWMFDGVKHYQEKTTRKVLFEEDEILENVYSELKFVVHKE